MSNNQVPNEVALRVIRSMTPEDEKRVKQRPLFPFIFTDPARKKRLVAVKWSPDDCAYRFQYAAY